MTLGRGRIPGRTASRMPLLKKLFWAYFLLLIFEGALRKWVVPQLSAPLLLVRDPIAIFIIWEAYRTHKWPKKWSVVTGILAAVLLGLCLAQMIAGENPWVAGLYGLRSYLLPFPVAFIMGENLDAEDLRKFGICILWLALPLVALEAAQYGAGPTSPLNAGASQGAAQIGYTGGHVRASATFSFVTGPGNFLTLAAAFIFYGLTNDRFAKRWLLWAASFALILSVPVTGSRTMVGMLAGVLACVAVCALFGVSQFTKSLKLIVPLLVVFFLVSLLPVFSDATDSLFQRFTEASTAEGGSAESSLVLRLLKPVTGTIEVADFTGNWLGLGMGHGSAAVTTLLSGTAQFLAGEDEFPRVLNEFGPSLGVAFMLFRWFLGLMILAKALSCARDQQPLALLLVPLVLKSLAICIMEQPTDQGFLVIGIAFALAALKRTDAAAQWSPALSPGWRRARQNMRA